MNEFESVLTTANQEFVVFLNATELSTPTGISRRASSMLLREVRSIFELGHAQKQERGILKSESGE